MTASRSEPAARSSVIGVPSRRAVVVLLVVGAAALSVVIAISVNAQHGVFTYAIDDAAIHLTLARNLAHGTFGLVPSHYESASSAPLWELLLAPFLRVLPDAYWAPLLLNVLASGWLLVSFARLPFVHRMVRNPIGMLGVAALPIGLGLVPLVLTGMEHTMHAAVVVQLLVWLDARVRGAATRRLAIGWYALLAGASLLRFETMFVGLGLALALVIIPKVAQWRVAATTIAAAFLPVAGFAVVNRSFGQYALPNSVVAKTAVGDGSVIPSLSQVVTRLTDDPLLLIVALVAVVLLARQLRAPSSQPEHRIAAGGLVAMLVTMAFHVSFADVGWFDRYQAYLVIGLVFSIVAVLADVRLTGRVGIEAIAAVVIVLSVLRVNLLMSTPGAQYNIYEGQYQTGQFLRQAYDGQAVAVGDIGYVSWFHQGDLVDVAGLGSYEVLAARKEHRFGVDFTMKEFADHHVDVLVVYSVYFGTGGQLPGWSAGGRWCYTSKRVVLSDTCIVFYAPEGPALDRLRAELARYTDKLPEGVESVPV
jgi:hypothetical protein